MIFGEYGDDLTIDYRLAKGLYKVEDKGGLFVVGGVEKRVVDVESFFDGERLDAVVKDGVAVVEGLVDGVVGVFVGALEMRQSCNEAKAVPVELAYLSLQSHQTFGLFDPIDFGDECIDLLDDGLELFMSVAIGEVFEQISLIFGFGVVERLGIGEGSGGEDHFELFEMELFGDRFVVGEQGVGIVLVDEVYVYACFGALFDEVDRYGGSGSSEDDALDSIERNLLDRFVLGAYLDLAHGVIEVGSRFGDDELGGFEIVFEVGSFLVLDLFDSRFFGSEEFELLIGFMDEATRVVWCGMVAQKWTHYLEKFGFSRDLFGKFGLHYLLDDDLFDSLLQELQLGGICEDTPIVGEESSDILVDLVDGFGEIEIFRLFGEFGDLLHQPVVVDAKSLVFDIEAYAQVCKRLGTVDDGGLGLFETQLFDGETLGDEA